MVEERMTFAVREHKTAVRFLYLFFILTLIACVIAEVVARMTTGDMSFATFSCFVLLFNAAVGHFIAESIYRRHPVARSVTDRGGETRFGSLSPKLVCGAILLLSLISTGIMIKVFAPNP